MSVTTGDVRDGNLNGSIVWICHYNRPDLGKKALRNVPPTKVIVRPISDLPPNKKVYYSQSFFSPLNKDGKPLARVISPVDNTGYRGYIGNELFTFDNEEACVAEWNKQIDECCARIDVMIKESAQTWIDDKDKTASAKR